MGTLWPPVLLAAEFDGASGAAGGSHAGIRLVNSAEGPGNNRNRRPERGAGTEQVGDGHANAFLREDLVLYNGKVRTMDDRESVVSAMKFRLALGSGHVGPKDQQDRYT